MAEKRRRIREIEADPNLTAAEKNQKKMEVLTGRAAAPVPSPAAAAGARSSLPARPCASRAPVSARSSNERFLARRQVKGQDGGRR